MKRFVTRIGVFNTTFDYSQGIKLSDSEVSYIKPKKDIVKPRKSMGRSLVLRRSTKRHK